MVEIMLYASFLGYGLIIVTCLILIYFVPGIFILLSDIKKNINQN